MVTWRKSIFVPEAKAHGFVDTETTTSACGRDQHPGNVWTEPLTNEPNDKCKQCAYILEGADVIARIKASGGGIFHF